MPLAKRLPLRLACSSTESAPTDECRVEPEAALRDPRLYKTPFMAVEEDVWVSSSIHEIPRNRRDDLLLQNYHSFDAAEAALH